MTETQQLDWLGRPMSEEAAAKMRAVREAVTLSDPFVKAPEPGGDHSVQGSEAWKRWRGKGVGSSDAAVLLGWSPYKTIDQLLLEKQGLYEQEFGSHQRSAMERGKRLEPIIRRWYEKKTGALFTEDTAEHALHPQLRASYDGIHRTFKNPDGSVGRLVEIKAPNRAEHEGAKEGFVPEKYQAQCQWLMLVAGFQWLDYVSYGSDETYAVVEVKAIPAIQRELLSRALIFWDLVNRKAQSWPDFRRYTYIREVAIDLSGVEVQRSSAATAPSVEDQDIEGLAARVLQAQDEMKTAEGRYEGLKEALKQRHGDRPAAVYGEAVVEWQERKGAVDYGKIPVLKDLDLEQYRKGPNRAFIVKRRAMDGAAKG